MWKVKAWIRFWFKKGRLLRATKKMLIVLICAKNALSSRHGETFPGIGSLPFSMQVGLKFLCRPTAKWLIYLTIHLTSTDVLLKWYQKYVLTKASSLGVHDLTAYRYTWVHIAWKSVTMQFNNHWLSIDTSSHHQALLLISSVPIKGIYAKHSGAVALGRLLYPTPFSWCKVNK